MVLTLPSAVGKALPITLKEFGASLSSTWNHQVQGLRNPTTLGLAVSGGVDSMALASLCAKLQSSDSSDWRFRAFVVDHGARAGSDEEARAVAELVSKKGIETRVLKIEWPNDIIPSKSSKFESLARSYRFRILGEACRDSNVRNLLLAHHEDDHYETLLMRLAVGHRGRGLLGIKPNAQLPECYGIYGVFDSGDGTSARMGMGASKGAGRQILGHMQHEDGGIRVLRPLLQYNKERLVATCLQDGTSWFEDHTNADATLTPRNAVRRIYKHHALPAALQKDAIVALSNSMQKKKDSLERAALALLHHCDARNFQPRVGSVFIRFPKITAESILAIGKEQTGAEQSPGDVACRLLKYAIETVSPLENTQYPLDRVCKNVFPELNTADDHGKVYPARFTVGGVLFQKIEPANSIQDEGGAASEVKSEREPQQHVGSVPMQDREWFLSRQPYPSMLGRRPLLEFPPQASFKDANDGWKLFDGRYWIRVLNYTHAPVRLRPLRRADLAGFKNAKFVHHRLRTIAPGDLRFILPVIVAPAPAPAAAAAAEPAAPERVLALPTLDVWVPGARKSVQYEIRYKKVEWPRLQEMGRLSPGPALGGGGGDTG